MSAERRHRIPLEFDGRIVVVETNLDYVAGFVRESHSPLLTHSEGSQPTVVSILRGPISYTLGDRVFPAELPVESLTHEIKQRILAAFVAQRPEYLWLHAAAVAKHDEAILIVAPSSGGKSSLAIALCRVFGWCLLSDEAAPISPETLAVHPWPRMPVRRVYPGRHLGRRELGDVFREEWVVPKSAIRRTPATVRALVLASFGAEAGATLTEATRRDSVVALSSAAINLRDHGERGLQVIASLADAAPAISLQFHDGLAAAEEIDKLFSNGHLGIQPGPQVH